MQIDLQQIPPDALSELGLVHKYPLHIDVVNNETGFALYVETPAAYSDDDDWGPLFGGEDENGAKPVHVDDYVPGLEPEYILDHWYDDAYLRIREVGEDGAPGPWHTTRLEIAAFAKNTNPPPALDKLGFDDFDSVAWLEGLEPGRDYQVQVWFDLDEDGQLDPRGRWERGHKYVYDEDGNQSVAPGDYYTWQEADVYSGVHDLNTDAQDFNLDIDCDGIMDFFIA